MKRSKVNLVVFSQTTELSDITAIIRNRNSAVPFLVLSSHKPFETERDTILRNVEQRVMFKSFADFLTDEEMSYCDTHSYDVELEKSDPEMPSLRRYYERIKREKNALILEKIQKEYKLAERYLCADDLGIALDVWLGQGFTCYSRQEQQAFEEPRATTVLPVIKNRFLWALKKLKRSFSSVNEMLENVFVLQTPVGNFIFLGSVVRIRPYLKNVNIQRLQPGLITKLVNLFLISILMPFNQLRKTLLPRLQRTIISRYARAQRTSVLLSTMHEYRLNYTQLANRLNMDLVILQDGFLPENYSSRYLAFYFGVREFWVWDRLSLGLFKNHELRAEVCSFLSVPELPAIEKDQYEVRTILVLTSGAGDWTALKNRSDDDLMVMVFAEVARKFPDIEIIYRCHPLWAHKEHQGVDSIKRVDKYFKQLNLDNISVSKGSLDQSERFLIDKGLWVATGSVEGDIEKADLVFGEHSFSMITAAMRKKIFASVNLTRRRDLFYSYSKLGFPHLVSVREVCSFIEQLGAAPTRIIDDHNKAVKRYNTQMSK